METLFLWCAGIGGTIILCQFLASLLGLGSDHDTDAGGDHDADSSDHHNVGWFFGILTVRTVGAGITFFGLGGLSALNLETDVRPATAFAAFCGVAAVVAVAQIMQFFKRLQHDGTVDIESALGEVGSVYLRIPGESAGPGKVTLRLQNRTVECEAFTKASEIATGQPVRVVSILGPNTLEVEPITGATS